MENKEKTNQEKYEEAKTFTIVVNEKKYDWNKESIDYLEVVGLSEYSFEDRDRPDIQYTGGAGRDEEGILINGEGSVKVKDGTTFFVKPSVDS